MNVAHLNEQQAGQPARTVGRFVPHEIIGPPGCPIMYRWTLLKFGRAAVHRPGRPPHSSWRVEALGRTLVDCARRDGDQTETSRKVVLHHFLPNADDRAEHDHPAAFLTLVLAGGYDDLVPCADCAGRTVVDEPQLTAELHAAAEAPAAASAQRFCRFCTQPVTLASDGAWETADGRCGCGVAEHSPDDYVAEAWPPRAVADENGRNDPETHRVDESPRRRSSWPMPCPTCTDPIDGPTGLQAGDRMRRGMIRRRAAEYRHRTKVLPSGCWTLVFMFAKSRPWGFWINGTWWPWREHEQTFGFGMRCPDDDATPAGR